MIPFRALSTASLLGLLVTLAGCSGEATAASGADTSNSVKSKDTVAAAQPAGDQARGPSRGHGPGGPDFLLVAALHEPSLSLTAAQKSTIEGALEASKPAGPPPFDKTRVSALAAGVRAGKVEAQAFQPPGEDLRAAHQAATAKALGTLHATLTPAQRTALVEAVAKHAEDHGPPMGKGKEGERPHPMDHAGGPRGPMGPMGGMLEGLDLTQAQEEAIKAKLDAQRPAPPSEGDRAAMKTQHEAMRAAMDAKLKTFASDTFDATAFVTPPAGAPKGPGPGADRFAADLQIIVSVLDPAQREKLAARIEAGPPGGARAR